MPKVSFEVPVEVKKTMTKRKDIKWDMVVSDALWSYTKKLELLDSITGKSTFTEDGAAIINRNIKKRLAAKYKART